MPEKLEIDGYRIMQIMLNLVGNAVKFTDSGSISVSLQWYEGRDAMNKIQTEPKPFDDSGVFERRENFNLITRSKGESGNHHFLNLDNRMLTRTESAFSVNRRPQEGVLKITIRDTGCGMSEESASKLFKMFSQVHDDPSKRKVGTGLGLYITKELCTNMNGEIKAYSQVNMGSAFVVTIPTKASS